MIIVLIRPTYSLISKSISVLMFPLQAVMIPYLRAFKLSL